AGRPVAKSRGGGTGERVGRGGKGRGPKGSNGERADELNSQGNEYGMGANGGVEGVNGNVEVGNQGNVRSQNGNVVNENIQENVRNVLVNSNHVDCSYKEFLACNPKEYDGHAAYTDRFHKLTRLIPHLVTHKDDNKRTRTGNAFDTIANPVKRENTGTWPKCTTYNSYHAFGGPCRACFNYNRSGHFEMDCRVVPRNVNRLNRTQGPGGNRPNQVVANNEGQDCGNHKNQARGRTFMLGAEEALQDSNIMTCIVASDLGFSYEIEIASGQLLLELMLSKRSKKNTKCVNAVNGELTAAKHKLMLLVY
nr:hypothetical protein [Tanacetum cinerariifolium]